MTFHEPWKVRITFKKNFFQSRLSPGLRYFSNGHSTYLQKGGRARFANCCCSAIHGGGSGLHVWVTASMRRHGHRQSCGGDFRSHIPRVDYLQLGAQEARVRASCQHLQRSKCRLWHLVCAFSWARRSPREVSPSMSDLRQRAGIAAHLVQATEHDTSDR